MNPLLQDIHSALEKASPEAVEAHLIGATSLGVVTQFLEVGVQMDKGDKTNGDEWRLKAVGASALAVRLIKERS